jgi:hypothetical protein
MMNVDLEREILDKEGRQLMWKALDKLFFVQKERAKETNEFVLSNLQQIAKENLEGQCTKGNSCKNSSVVLLQKLIAKGENACRASDVALVSERECACYGRTACVVLD